MALDLKSLTISRDATIHDAVAAIDRGGRQIALVVDEVGKLVAAITDGDVRRGLLRSMSFEAPARDIMRLGPTTADVRASRASVRRMMREKSLHHVPIVDEAGHLVDLVWIDDVVGPRQHGTRIVLMAGGLGTRLRPLTDDTPKPMLKIGGRPLLEVIIRNFLDQGFDQFTLSVNYRAEIIRDHFGDGRDLGVRIDYVEEPDRMGTAGALSLMAERPKEPFIVMNGDLLTTMNFDALLRFHGETGAEATMCAREYQMQVPYGVIRTDGRALFGIEEKPIETYFVNAGIYVLSPTVFDLIDQGKMLDMPVLFERVIERKGIASVFPVRDYWMDIGRIEDLERARAEFNSVFVS